MPVSDSELKIQAALMGGLLFFWDFG